MPKYNLLYKKTAVKDIKSLPPQIQKRLGDKLLFFASQDKPLEFAAALTKPSDAQYRYRVGDYRILFDIEGSDIIILTVQHRREVYRK